MASRDIKDVMSAHIKVTDDLKSLSLEINRFNLVWIQKSDVYIEFLGSNLFGVHQIRFSENDENMLFLDVLKTDRNLLRTDIYTLKDINKKRKVTSDETLLTLVYLMHVYATSNLDDNAKDEAIKNLYYTFAYKVISSLYSHYFSYSVDVSIAKAVYEQLTSRFLLKKLGSWQEVFNYRSKDVRVGGLHYKRLLNFNTIWATKIVSDMQGRIRELLKYMYPVLIKVKDQNLKVVSTSIIEEGDEEDGIRDSTSRPDVYVNYLRSIFNKPNDFLNDDLVYLIKTVNPNVDEEKFVDTLKYITNNVIPKIGDESDVIENIVQISINYLKTKNIHNNFNNHAYDILKYMKGYWSSSSVKDPVVKRTKELVYDYALKATGKKTNWLLASISISVLMYLFLRSIYKNK